MKKKEKKSPERRIPTNNSDLGGLGLEPPKIYRESQNRNIAQNDNIRSRQKKEQPLPKNEVRRRQSQKRKKKNKIRKIFIWFVICVLLLAVGIVLSLTVFFHIDTVTVEGNEKYTEEEILTQCTVDAGENLFLADTKTAKNMLEQNLPYIYNAQFKRKIPSTMCVVITESEPAYCIKNKDKTYTLLDDNFKVLENKAKKGSGIAISKAKIKSCELGHTIEFKDENVSECLSTMAKAVADNNIKEITGIYCNNISDNYLVYDNRISFKIGTCDDIDSKLYQGLTACEQLNESSPNAKGTMTIKGGKQIYFTEE